MDQWRLHAVVVFAAIFLFLPESYAANYDELSVAFFNWPLDELDVNGTTFGGEKAQLGLEAEPVAALAHNIPDQVETAGIKAMSFDGESSWANLGYFSKSCISDVNLCTKGFTLSVLYFAENLPTETGYLVSSGGQSPSSRGFYFGYIGDKEAYEVGVISKQQRWFINFELQTMQWTNILFTWSNDTGVELYVDGELAAHADLSLAIIPDTLHDADRDFDPAPNLFLGRANHMDDYYGQGYLSTLVFMEEALTIDDVKKFINADLYYIDCVEDDPQSPVYTVSPSVPPADLSPANCREACAADSYPIAVLKDACFCSSDMYQEGETTSYDVTTCGTACIGEKPEGGTCGTQSAAALFYTTALLKVHDLPEELTGLSGEVKFSSTEIETDETIMLNITNAAGADLSYYVDFKDGTEPKLTTSPHVYHRFTEAGMYNVSIMAWNDVTYPNVYYFVPTEVEDFVLPVRSLDVYMQGKFTELGNPTTFERDMATDASVRCVWDFGDTTTEEITEDGDYQTEFTHTYTEVGVYTVTLTCSSKRNTMVAETTALVGQSLRVEAVNNLVVEFGDAASLTWRIEQGEWRSVSAVRLDNVSIADITVDEGGHSASAEITQSDYTCPGTHVAVLEVTNPVSSLVHVVFINVEDRITGFQATADKYYATPLETVTFTTRIAAGSNAFYLWDFYDTKTFARKVRGPTPGEGHEEVMTFNFSSPDVYDVKVEVANFVSSEKETLTIKIENIVEGLYLVANNVSSPNDTVTFIVSQEPGFTKPTDPKFIFDFDNQDSSDESFDLSVDDPYRKDYVFGVYGFYDVTVRIVNHVSETQLSTIIMIGDYLFDLEILTPSYLYTSVSENFTLEATVRYGAGVVFLVDYGDGTTDDNSYDPVNGGDIYQFYHIYQHEGKYKVKVTAQNHLNSLEAELDQKVHVMNAAREMTLTSSKPDPLPPGIVTFAVSLPEGIGSPSNMTCDFEFGDGEGLTVYPAVVTSKRNLTVQHTYKGLGKTDASALCWNDVSDQRITAEVHMQEPVGDIDITIVTPVHLEFGDEANVEIDLSAGTEVTMELDMGDGHVETFYIEGPAAEITTTAFTHTYPRKGLFNVTVTAYNLISWRQFMYEEPIVVEHPVRDVRVFSNAPVYYPPGNVTFTVMYEGDGFPPTDILVDWTWGDGTIKTSGPVSIDDTHRYDEVYQYGPSNFGEIVTHAQVRNFISAQNFTVVSWMSEAISGLAISMYSVVGDSETQEGFGPNQDYFPIQYPIRFTASVETGKVVSWLWNFGDGSVAETPGPVAEHKYASDGAYYVTVQAKNPNENVTEVLNKAIIVQEPMRFISLGTSGSRVRPGRLNDTITFMLKTEHLGTHACYVWDNGDGAVDVYGDPLAGCADIPAYRDYPFHEINPKKQKYINHTHTYLGLGLFKIRINGSNAVSSIVLEDRIHILNVECDYPIVEMQGEGKTFNTRRVHTRSSKVPLMAIVSLNCDAGNAAQFNWQALKLKEGTGSNGKPQEWEVYNMKFKRKADVLFKARTFEYGFYKLTLEVEIDPEVVGTEGIANEDFRYFEIIKSDLKAGIKGGISKAVDNDTLLLLDASSLTYDPDVEKWDKTGMEYFWYCRLPFEILPDNPDDSTEGGCYDTGYAPFNTSTDYYYLNTTDFSPGETYVTRIVAKKDDRVAMFEQTLEVLPPVVPQMEVRCVSNCWKKVNPRGVLKLQAVCTSCRRGNRLTYTWKLFRVNHTIPEKAPLLEEVPNLGNLSQTGASTSSLAIRPDTLEQGATYRVRVKAYANNPETPGFSEGEYVINYVPYGGKCDISPKVGHAYDTMFIVECTGWKDEGDLEQRVPPGVEPPKVTLKYKFNSIIMGDTNLIYFGNIPFTMPVQIAMGDCERDFAADILVQVFDAYEAYADYRLIVKVKPPKLPCGVNSYEELFLRVTDGPNSELARMMAETKSKETASLMESLTSVMNSKCPIEPQLDPECGIPTVPPDENIRKEHRKRIRKIMASNVGTIGGVAEAPEDILQAASATRTISGAPDELERGTQEGSIDSLSGMTGQFDGMGEEVDEEMVNQVAGDLVGSLGSVMKASETSDVKEMFDNLSKPPPPDVPPPDQSVEEYLFYEEMKRRKKYLRQLAERPSAKKVANTGMGAASTAAKSVSGKKLIGEAPTVIESDQLNIAVVSDNIEDSGNKSLDIGGGSFALPSAGDMFGNDTEMDSMNTVVMSNPTNPFTFDDSAKAVTSPVVTMNFMSSNGSNVGVKGISTNISITIENRMSGGSGEPKNITWLKSNPNDTYVMKAKVPNEGNALIFGLVPNQPDLDFDVYVRFAKPPTREDYDFVAQVAGLTEEELFDVGGHGVPDTFLVFVPNYIVAEPGFYYFAIDALSEEVTVEESEQGNGGKATMAQEVTLVEEGNTTVEFKWIVFSPGCKYWDEEGETWSNEGCSVSALTTSKFTVCDCNHLTSFGSEMVVAPNTIDFSNVFAKFANLSDNAAVFSVVVSILLLYVILLVFTRRADKYDIIKWGTLPLVDNAKNDRYFYKLDIYTGMRPGAGTKSRVNFILSGEEGDSGVRIVDDGKRELMRRGNIDHVLLGVPRSLGYLTFLRVWHDNSGKGKYQSWYCNKVVIQDIQTGERFYFLCDRWLAVEEDDGLTDRILPVAGTENIIGFNHLFFSSSKRNLSDGHLWYSVASRPTRSNFTRTQRLTCCVALLFLTMIANAMFYKKSEVEDPGEFSLGPITLSLTNIIISIESTFVVLPASMALVTFFKKAKYKPTPAEKEAEERKKEEEKKKKEEEGKEKEFDDIGKELEPEEKEAMKLKEAEALEEGKEPTAEEVVGILNTPKPSPEQSLPWWIIYVGWVLAFFSILGPAFFVILYSLQWGKAKAEGWLSCMMLSIFQSTLVVQPIKIVAIAMLVAIIFKKPTEEEDDSLPEEYKLGQDEEWIDTEENGEGLAEHRAKAPPPMITEEQLRDIKETRRKEITMWAIIKEFLAYTFFLTVLLLLANEHRDKQAFGMHTSLQNEFVGSFTSKVSNVANFWKWAKGSLIPALYQTGEYNGDKVAFHNRKFVSDLNSYRIGPARFRQLRVKSETCQTTRVGIEECYDAYSFGDAQKGVFKPNWVAVNESEDYVPWDLWFVYQTSGETKGVPIIAEKSVYGAGGYVVELGVNNPTGLMVLDQLFKETWIDHNTRAVVTEFSVYNANINLFGCVILTAEFPPTGAASTYAQVKIFRLYSYVGSLAIIIIAAQILWVIFIVYFTIREIGNIRKQKKEYFKSFWNWVEMVIILMSFVSLAMYAYRVMGAGAAMEAFQQNPRKFVSFQRLATMDEMYVYVMSTLTYVGVFKFMRLMRFNKRVCILLAIIKNSIPALGLFTVMFTICMTAFALSGLVIFGQNMPGFKNLLSTYEGLLAMVLGDLNFDDMRNTHAILGPVYFCVFVNLMIMLVMNMFVSILDETYGAVMEDESQHGSKEDEEMVEFMWMRFKRFTGIGGRPKPPEPTFEDGIPFNGIRVTNASDKFVYRGMMDNYYDEQDEGIYEDDDVDDIISKWEMDNFRDKKKKNLDDDFILSKPNKATAEASSPSKSAPGPKVIPGAPVKNTRRTYDWKLPEGEDTDGEGEEASKEVKEKKGKKPTEEEPPPVAPEEVEMEEEMDEDEEVSLFSKYY
ncbi:polycystin family receptor for egg jelly-like isoform X1 [Branchiostoma lanceolatum]|uniref:polycystin family receptor for egg jelly-like isoform X1 n=1 Tax=Branchiostoma lanceolatum TaxID=7740 RepID=UPI0034563969